MKEVVLLAGATGNLGGRIVEALLQRGAQVRALVRQGTEVTKLDVLIGKGVQVYVVDMMNLEEVSKACNGVSCVVSALAGLDDVIIEMQRYCLMPQ
jgi:uncharacterized protein YbjT (DUF2867 family)